MPATQIKFPRCRGQQWLGNNMGTVAGSYAIRVNSEVRGTIEPAGLRWQVWIDGEQVGKTDYLEWAKDLAREKLQ